MKTITSTLVLTLCLFVLPTFANDLSKKELRKEKRRFTKKVRAMKEAENQNENHLAVRGKWE